MKMPVQDLTTDLGRAPETPSNPYEEFVQAMSHDLRGPLLNFQGFLRRLSMACEALERQALGWNLTSDQRQACKQLLDNKIRASVEVLERNSRRMDVLLAALLQLSRAGREPPRFERLDTGELVRTIAASFAGSLQEKKARLKIEQVPELWADKKRMEQVFQELLRNAVKFLSPDRPGEISVCGTVAGDTAVCWVQDNGIGIRSEEHGRIFVPFGKLREIEAPGEGVGLATVRKLIEQQGGRVWIESTHGEGSIFYFCLPAQAP